MRMRQCLLTLDPIDIQRLGYLRRNLTELNTKCQSNPPKTTKINNLKYAKIFMCLSHEHNSIF